MFYDSIFFSPFFVFKTKGNEKKFTLTDANHASEENAFNHFSDASNLFMTKIGFDFIHKIYIF